MLPLGGRHRLNVSEPRSITSNLQHQGHVVRELARRPEEMKVALMVTVAGILGFVALLVASTYFAYLATPIRVAAFAWFVVFGGIRTSMFWKRGAGRARW